MTSLQKGVDTAALPNFYYLPFSMLTTRSFGSDVIICTLPLSIYHSAIRDNLPKIPTLLAVQSACFKHDGGASCQPIRPPVRPGGLARLPGRPGGLARLPGRRRGACVAIPRGWKGRGAHAAKTAKTCMEQCSSRCEHANRLVDCARSAAPACDVVLAPLLVTYSPEDKLRPVHRARQGDLQVSV